MSIKPPRRHSGFSLVELVMVIVIIGVGIAGVLSTMNVSILHAGDPMMRKQMIAVAESLLSEVIHQPMTWCDPDDANAATASSAGGCASGANDQNNGGGAFSGSIPGGESRSGSAGQQFDNVADYANYGQSDATDAAGNNLLSGYATSVAIQRVGTAWGLADNTAALQVTVTVTHAGDSVSLSGYRFRYAPRY